MEGRRGVTSDHKNVWNIFELRSRSGGWKAGSLKSNEVSHREEVEARMPTGRSFMDEYLHIIELKCLPPFGCRRQRDKGLNWRLMVNSV